MLRIQLQLHPVSGYRVCSEQTIACFPYSNCDRVSWSSFKYKRFGQGRGVFIACKASPRSFNGQPENRDERENEFLEAFVLSSETIRHHKFRKQGFLEEIQWRSSGQLLPFAFKVEESKADVISFGHGFLHLFRSPTIFLKIACNGDLLLPIVVGEFAIEKLVDALRENENAGCPNQFQFVKNLVGTLGYEVRFVRITERVVNTYYARIYLGKPGEKTSLSVDARPSDAINVAKRCKAPIYVSKKIVSTDAIKIVYGKRRGVDEKSVYDVYLDSATDCPDPVAEELDLVQKMNLAIIEERYQDAALWRDKLTELRMSRYQI